VQNVSVTALSTGIADITGGSLGHSTIIGLEGINISGDSSGAALLSNNQISGGSGSQTGFAQGTTANAASQSLQSETAAQPAVASTDETADDKKKKQEKEVVLAQKTGRVTVILPAKPQARRQSPGQNSGS